MKALLAALLLSSATLTSGQFASAQSVPLETGGLLTMGAGSGLLAYDIYRVRSAMARSAEAQARLESSASYRQFVSAQKEFKTAEAEFDALKAAGTASETELKDSFARLVQKEDSRNRLLGRVLDRDILRFDPLVEGRPLGPSVEASRKKVLERMKVFENKVSRLKNVRRLGLIGLVVGGGAIVFLTAEESSSGLAPAEAFNGMSREAKNFVAAELEPVPRWMDVSIEEALDGYGR